MIVKIKATKWQLREEKSTGSVEDEHKINASTGFHCCCWRLRLSEQQLSLLRCLLGQNQSDLLQSTDLYCYLNRLCSFHFIDWYKVCTQANNDDVLLVLSSFSAYINEFKALLHLKTPQATVSLITFLWSVWWNNRNVFIGKVSTCLQVKARAYFENSKKVLLLFSFWSEKK